MGFDPSGSRACAAESGLSRSAWIADGHASGASKADEAGRLSLLAKRTKPGCFHGLESRRSGEAFTSSGKRSEPVFNVCYAGPGLKSRPYQCAFPDTIPGSFSGWRGRSGAVVQARQAGKADKNYRSPRLPTPTESGRSRSALPWLKPVKRTRLVCFQIPEADAVRLLYDSGMSPDHEDLGRRVGVSESGRKRSSSFACRPAPSPTSFTSASIRNDSRSRFRRLFY